ncbi:MAG TPA: hypothetical protein VN951_05855 [Pyrinomonadaceae bacterium]|nr:hypothetical protein [Pyrinomonadaceae bacterium]
MFRTILLSIFIALSFATVSAQQPRPSPVAVPVGLAWINGAPANAGFTILMPGKPTEQVQPVAGHPDLENHLLALETSLASYVVSYLTLADDVTDPAIIKVLLDRGREDGLTSSGGTLKSEKEITLNKYFGREWLIELPGGFSATARAYWVKRRLFQTVFITTPEPDDSAEVKRLRQETATKFLDSFTLSDDTGN